MVRIEIVLLGKSPLLCHNPRMVDPEYPLNREIKALTSKRKKTEADLKDIEHLEWRGGMYEAVIDGKEVISQPCSKVRKCLINAAKITKQGKSVERALIMSGLDIPLIYAGSENVNGDIRAELDRLEATVGFASRLSVGIGNKRVMRVRPEFMPWALIVEAFWLEDAGLNFDEFQRIVELAGNAERIGDNRVNGYGSFYGHARIVEDGVKPITPTIDGVRKFFQTIEED